MRHRSVRRRAPWVPFNDGLCQAKYDLRVSARFTPRIVEETMPITTEDMVRWIQRVAMVLHENRDYLTQLDSPIGDADHGINMDRGFKAVLDRLPAVAHMDIGSILKTVGTTLVSTVGGASGPLYGTAFLRAGMVTSGKHELYEADVVTLLE